MVCSSALPSPRKDMAFVGASCNASQLWWPLLWKPGQQSSEVVPVPKNSPSEMSTALQQVTGEGQTELSCTKSLSDQWKVKPCLSLAGEIKN